MLFSYLVIIRISNPILIQKKAPPPIFLRNKDFS